MSERFRIVEKYEVCYGAELGRDFDLMRKLVDGLVANNIEAGFYEEEVFYGMALSIDEPRKIVEKYETLMSSDSIDQQVKDEVLPSIYNACKKMLADPNSYIQPDKLGVLYIKLL